MKKEKSSQPNKKRSAEEWVQIARKFGEECVKLQQDSKLNIDQKLAKQKKLGTELNHQIQSDPHLSEQDKKQMIESINSYIDDWKTVHDIAEQAQQIEKQNSK